MHLKRSLRKITDYLAEFCGRYKDVRIGVDSNVLRTYLVEEGLNKPVPAIRLSDGTMKFLCLQSLLTVLLNPNAPPLFASKNRRMASTTSF